jgi:hypothetical protein
VNCGDGIPKLGDSERNPTGQATMLFTHASISAGVFWSTTAAPAEVRVKGASRWGMDGFPPSPDCCVVFVTGVCDGGGMMIAMRYPTMIQLTA